MHVVVIMAYDEMKEKKKKKKKKEDIKVFAWVQGSKWQNKNKNKIK